MLNGTLGEHSMLDILSWIGLTSATGSLRIDASTSGDVFFDKGAIYYASTDDHPLTMTELTEAGITEPQWRQAAQHPQAQVDFGAALLAVGVLRTQIQTFITQRIAVVVETLAGLESGTFATSTGRHGFGSTFSVGVKEILDGQHGELHEDRSGYPDDSLISFTRSATGNVTLTGSQWSAVASLLAPTQYTTMRRLLGDDEASSFIEYMESNGFVRISTGGSPAAPTETNWWATDGQTTDVAATFDEDLYSNTQVTAPEATPIYPDEPAESSIVFDGSGDQPATGFDTDSDNSEPGPESVENLNRSDGGDFDMFEGLDIAPGRAAYADIARLRAIQYEAPNVKAGAIRKLIHAVRGL